MGSTYIIRNWLFSIGPEIKGWILPITSSYLFLRILGTCCSPQVVRSRPKMAWDILSVCVCFFLFVGQRARTALRKQSLSSLTELAPWGKDCLACRQFLTITHFLLQSRCLESTTVNLKLDSVSMYRFGVKYICRKNV